MKVLPFETLIVPWFVKLPALVKFWFPASVKLPVLAFVLNPASRLLKNDV